MPPNASLQLLPTAGARHERRLLAVSCKALFGAEPGMQDRLGDCSANFYPPEVLIHPPEGGLQSHSVVLLHQIRSIDKRRPVRHMGKLNPETREAVLNPLEHRGGLVATPPRRQRGVVAADPVDLRPHDQALLARLAERVRVDA